MKFIKHNNVWCWGNSTIIIINDGCGTITVQFEKTYPNEAFITSLSVYEEKRNQGYAKKLMEEAEKLAKEHNCDTILLKSDMTSWVYDWYKRLGYEFCGFDTDENFDNKIAILTKDI